MQSIRPAEFHALLSGPAASRFCLLDVREAWEVSLAKVEHPALRTLHIPMGQIPQRVVELSERGVLVCLCHHGVRSAQVASFLMGEGLQDVLNLSGGIHEWSTSVDSNVPLY